MFTFIAAFIAAFAVTLVIIVQRDQARQRKATRTRGSDVISGRQQLRRVIRDEAYRQIGGAPISRRLKRLAARSLQLKLKQR